MYENNNYDISDSEIANYDQTHPHYTDKQNTKHYTYFVCQIMCIVFMSGAQLHPSLVLTHYDKKNEVMRTVCYVDVTVSIDHR